MDQRNKSLMLFAAGILAVIVIGAGVFALSSGDDTDTADTKTTQTKEDSMEPNDTAMAETESTSDIVSLAVATSDLSTLVTAVKQADLVDTLSGDGPFTVFAPTNEAFAALPDGTLDTLLMPENKADLQAILTYHVVSGKVMSSQLTDGQEITTVQGGTLTVYLEDGSVMLEDATGARAEVVTADVEASNGVVHIINKVVLPQ